MHWVDVMLKTERSNLLFLQGQCLLNVSGDAVKFCPTADCDDEAVAFGPSSFGSNRYSSVSSGISVEDKN